VAKCFTFALDCTTLSAPPEMLRDLSLQVLGYVGCADETVQATAEAVAIAVAEAAGSGVHALALTFECNPGTLLIVLSTGEREVWRVSHDVSAD
jgi:hypothetical protein